MPLRPLAWSAVSQGQLLCPWQLSRFRDLLPLAIREAPMEQILEILLQQTGREPALEPLNQQDKSCCRFCLACLGPSSRRSMFASLDTVIIANCSSAGFYLHSPFWEQLFCNGVPCLQQYRPYSLLALVATWKLHKGVCLAESCLLGVTRWAANFRSLAPNMSQACQQRDCQSIEYALQRAAAFWNILFSSFLPFCMRISSHVWVSDTRALSCWHLQMFAQCVYDIDIGFAFGLIEQVSQAVIQGSKHSIS